MYKLIYSFNIVKMKGPAEKYFLSTFYFIVIQYLSTGYPHTFCFFFILWITFNEIILQNPWFCLTYAYFFTIIKCNVFLEILWRHTEFLLIKEYFLIKYLGQREVYWEWRWHFSRRKDPDLRFMASEQEWAQRAEEKY